VAQVLALISDLLFGSQVQGMLASAGYEVELVADIAQAEKGLAGIGGKTRPAVLVIDLDSAEFDAVEFVRDRQTAGALLGTRMLGFYPHIDLDSRRLAEDAEFDLVVPRSRMAREGASLVAGLVGQ
jgi:hypothetical protein